MLTETLPEGNLRAILTREAKLEELIDKVAMTVILRLVKLAGEDGLDQGVADVKSGVVKRPTESGT